MDDIKPVDLVSEDENLEVPLRPKSLNDFDQYELGQKSVVEGLRISVTAAKKRNGVLEHLLFYGPPGLGKTTFAYVLGGEMGKGVRVTSGAAIKKSGDLAAVLSSMQEGEILFIDEIHRLSKVIEEVLYPAMEDFGLDIVIGKGPSARTIRLDLPRFTLIGATTRMGMISNPLRDRFGIVHRLDFYGVDELRRIVERAAGLAGIKVGRDCAEEIAKRSRGTPRVAIKLLRRVRDYSEVKNDGKITLAVVDKALEMAGVDADGLNDEDKRYLSAIVVKFDGGPVGLSTLSAAISEDIGTIEDVIEPFLIKEGFIKKTSQGRIATEKAYKKFGKRFDKLEQMNISV